jgi:hypothetical protein
VQHALQAGGISLDPDAFHSAVRKKHGVNTKGKTIIYRLNYSSTTTNVKYGGPSAHDVLTGNPVSRGQTLSIHPWDLVIAESDSNEGGPSQ